MTAPGRHRSGAPPPPRVHGRHRNEAVTAASAVAPPSPRVPLRRLLWVASVACGVQFGWALQLSLLTPYVQELGIPHAFASLVWLCGPLSGLIVQPLVGHLSDRSTSSFGRRRPYIVGGAATIALAVLLVGHSADLGRLLGDPPTGPRHPRAIAVYLLGFWLLDVGNNTTQGPCRALLADLAGLRSLSSSFLIPLRCVGAGLCNVAGSLPCDLVKLERTESDVGMGIGKAMLFHSVGGGGFTEDLVA